MNTTTRSGLLAVTLTLASCANTIEREFEIDAPIDSSWAVIGEDFGGVEKWASVIPSSYATVQDGVPTERVCESNIGSLKETVLEYDAEAHRVAYIAEVDDAPFFVSQLANSWTLTDNGRGGTTVRMEFDADLWPVFNVVMWPLMRGEFATLFDETVEELQYYVENGTPHPRKLEAIREAEESSS